MFKMYHNPKEVGWLGWFEDKDGKCTAFVDLERRVHLMCGLG